MTSELQSALSSIGATVGLITFVLFVLEKSKNSGKQETKQENSVEKASLERQMADNLLESKFQALGHDLKLAIATSDVRSDERGKRLQEQVVDMHKSIAALTADMSNQAKAQIITDEKLSTVTKKQDETEAQLDKLSNEVQSLGKQMSKIENRLSGHYSKTDPSK